MPPLFLPVVYFLAFAWVIAAITTFVQRAPYSCGPHLFHEGCYYALLNRIGDLTTFQWVKDWETLAGGAVALLAALIGAHYINKQLTLTKQLDRDTRERRATSFRAVLPLALSGVNQYASDCADVLVKYRDDLTNPLVMRATLAAPDMPALPQEGLPVFQGVIEHESQAHYREALAHLLRDMQILAARLKGIAEAAKVPGNHVMPHEVDGMLFYCVTVHARSSNLFDFARNMATEPKPVSQSVWNSLWVLHITDPRQHTGVMRSLESEFGPAPP